MIKTILVPVTAGAADRPLCDAALRVAASLRAHLQFVHVRLDPVEVAAVATAADLAVTPATGDWIEAMEQDATERATTAKAMIDELAAAGRIVLGDAGGRPGVAASYAVETGRESEWIARYARTADLLIAARGEHGSGRETIEAALLGSGRPVLIAAGSPLAWPPSRVAIAWKPTRESARAVDGALPLLAMAKHVSIIAVAEEEEEVDRGALARLRSNLGRHGLEVELHTPGMGDDPGATMIETALAAGADLVVMGGYGRSRFREFVFGGFTDRVLSGAPLPVLIAH